MSRAEVHDAISVEIFANLFRAVVDEMTWRVRRSAHSTFIKETQDFGTGLVTPQGEQFAVPDNTGGISLIGIPIRPLVDAFAQWKEGDVAITNDPYATRGMVMHLSDMFLLRPIFVDGRLLCFAWAFLHCSDVGGSVPGSIDNENREVFQEGLRLPPVRLYREGVLDETIVRIIASNCRSPDLNWGDISAIVSSLEVAEKRVQRLAERYGAAAIAGAMDATLQRTEALTLAAFQTIPQGSFEFTEYIEDDFVSGTPIRFQLELTVGSDGRCVLDFTGSDPQVAAAINLPTGSQPHHPMLSVALMDYAITRSPGLHVNAGIVRCIRLVLPERSVVNAGYPASCGGRVIGVMRIHDLTLGALSRVIPGHVPAAGASQLAVTTISVPRPDGSRRVVSANAVVGGSGGGCGLDGIAGTDFPAAALKSVPAEILESEAPVRIHRFALRPDSEGAGLHRGGFGIEYAFEITEPDSTVVCRGKDRHSFAAWGVAGGKAAVPGFSAVVRRDGTRIDNGKKAVFRPDLGDIMVVAGGGGGGFGSPFARSPEAVCEDVGNGLISPERARDVYGVVTDQRGTLDEEATVALRRRHSQKAGWPGFDFGEGRCKWERDWGAAYAAICDWVRDLAPGIRRSMQEKAYAAMRMQLAGPVSREVAMEFLEAMSAPKGSHPSGSAERAGPSQDRMEEVDA
ncbi:MAG: hydantoin utilization protein B [Alphaproteobacteria bacterium]|nr:MAG: hydantoin utilization protein B [Alphaproteobacteria bacterium]